MTNEEIFRQLLTMPPEAPLPVPSEALVGWVNSIPNRLAFVRARQACRLRSPEMQGFRRRHPQIRGSDADHRLWLTAEAFGNAHVSEDAA